MIKQILVRFAIFLLFILPGKVIGQKEEGLLDDKRKKIELNNYFISLNLEDGLNRITGAIEWKVDSLIKIESDPVTQNNLLNFKYNLINAISQSAFHADPLVGALDSWALIYQLIGYLEGSRCKALYGEHCLTLLSLFTPYLESYQKKLDPYLTPEDQEKLRVFASKHPIEDDNLNRRSIVPELSTWLSEDELGLKSGFITMADLMRDMVFRMQFYSKMLPKQTKWQVEGAIQAYMLEDSISRVVHNMNNLMNVSARTLDGMDGTISYNRDTVLANINFQRMAMEEFLSRERVAAMKDMEAISNQMLTGSVKAGKELIDYVFIRTLILFAALGVFVLIGLFIYKRSHS